MRVQLWREQSIARLGGQRWLSPNPSGSDHHTIALVANSFSGFRTFEVWPYFPHCLLLFFAKPLCSESYCSNMLPFDSVKNHRLKHPCVAFLCFQKRQS